ncbi:putative SWI/SNF-related matrix-associated actin-dependent regulator of chromatin subfamily A member 3-like 1 isoform X2 [Chenopodium quinoa]|uniref:putative SWI/SNF-related matrix-associated actin-dependent regulator of chromatin subfamily A member 3-like 1 isoform X2 n=1 Tax=Chenopodium quinoa TaxID=63459 RepID=UPI000B79294A|nr:putative SWI/SNF-related matrix-associated actin-dependent regulator of chromatin subfamily A member 3-like 1 isoform X2 [Chenopodium quinoa]
MTTSYNSGETQLTDPRLSLSSSSETYMVGFVIVKIVGMQHNTARISGRQLVGLVRDELNVHDENAIRVLNIRGAQVGYIERVAAKVLAPLMDTQLIIVQGIVPNTPNSGSRFKIPVQLHIFARIEAFPVVQSAILGGGLQLISGNSPSFALSDAKVVKEKRNSKDVKSVDEIFKLVGENVGRKEGLIVKLEPPKDVILPELFDHQKEGLGWLVGRENSEELPPFWEERDGVFVNVLTNYQTNTRPEPIRGGIFADDMGLGKTLTLLSLIVYDKRCCGSVGNTSENCGDGDNIDDSGDRKRKRGSVNTARKKRKVDSSDGVNENLVSSHTTLVVCSVSVFSVWTEQLSDHTCLNSLKYYEYHGKDRIRDMEVLKKYDVVLTSYNTLSAEESQSESPMNKMDWRRIILDEGHMIKNTNAKLSRAVTALNSKRRWVVTGTPIQNSSYDLFSLMAFLKFEPFSNKDYWNRVVQQPLIQGDKKGLERLQGLMATISLRRTKEQNLIQLPSKSIDTCYVELMHEERRLYDRMEEEAKQIVKNYINDGSVTRNYSTVLSIILRLRQICTDVALCPHDIKSLLPPDNVQDVSNNPELLEKLVSLLQDAEDFDCPICISPPADIIITSCAHIFCRACIVKTLKLTKTNCPMCRHPLSESELYSAPPPAELSDDNNTSSSPKASSKVSALLKLLLENRGVKSVVFSQFRKMLLLLEEPLKAAGIKTLRLDGSMSAKERGLVIQEFGVSEIDSPTVLLASLKASGTGINLTSASMVYLLEPWWNPATEEQAMDRVHRIGQKKDVKIVRIIARNTIEERVLELQKKKKELAKGAFGRKGKDKKETTVGDLCRLISLSA